MKSKKLYILSLILYAFVVLGGLFFGYLYLFRKDIMPYHYAFLGVTRDAMDALSPRIVNLMVILMKVGGANMLSVSVVSIFILAFPLRLNREWAKWTLFLYLSISLIPLAVITCLVASKIPSGEPIPPWYLTILLELFAIGGFIVSLLNKNESISTLYK